MEQQSVSIDSILKALEKCRVMQPMTVLDYQDDDALRFVQRVLESDSPASDRMLARDMIVEIRTRVRRTGA